MARREAQSKGAACLQAGPPAGMLRGLAVLDHLQLVRNRELTCSRAWSAKRAGCLSHARLLLLFHRFLVTLKNT